MAISNGVTKPSANGHVVPSPSASTERIQIVNENKDFTLVLFNRRDCCAPHHWLTDGRGFVELNLQAR